MLILAMDCASITSSVALIENQRVLMESTLNTGLNHSTQLMPMIDYTFKMTQHKISEIDAIAVTNGPGSFTGLRIGLSTVKGLSIYRNTPIIPINTLDALAFSMISWKGIVLPILNARRGEVYASIYKSDGDQIRRYSEYYAISLEELFLKLPKDQNIIVLGDGVDENKDIFINKENITLQKGMHKYVQSSVMGLIAEKKLSDKDFVDIKDLKAFYLRQSEAVINWQMRHPGENLNV